MKVSKNQKNLKNHHFICKHKTSKLINPKSTKRDPVIICMKYYFENFYKFIILVSPATLKESGH